MKKLEWMLTVLGLAAAMGTMGTGSAQADEADVFFDDSYVHEIHITLTDPGWYITLCDSHANNPEDPYFPAAVEEDGKGLTFLTAHLPLDDDSPVAAPHAG